MGYSKNRPFVKVDVTGEVDNRFDEVTSQLAENTQQTIDLQTNKLDKTGSIGVSQINKNRGLLDETYMSDTFKAQIAGTTAIGSTPPDKSITLVKTTFSKIGKNLFDKATVTLDRIISPTMGVEQTVAGYFASDYIEVLPSTTYTRSHEFHMAFYDANKVFISGINASEDIFTFTTPINALFVRSSNQMTDIDIYQIELGSSKTNYEDYKRYIAKEYVEKQTILTSDIPDSGVTYKKTDFVTGGKNLFNKETITAGFYINQTNGALALNASHNSSDYIDIVGSAQYVLSGIVSNRLAYYDLNKVFISGAQDATIPITTPSNAKFIRFSSYEVVTGLQFERGSVATLYEPYGYEIKKLLLQNTEKGGEVLAFLPSEICIAVGRTIEIYNAQAVWAGNLNNYHIKWTCAIGKPMERKWSFTGITEKIGTYLLTLTVYDNNMIAVASATTTIKVVSETLTTSKKVLTIGDSLTNQKPWLAELETLSASKIVQVGSRGTGTLMHEGRSGFSAGNYLTATDYTYESEGVHPFWNPDTLSFDYAYYKTLTGVIPDSIQLFLGTNGIALDPTVNATNIKTIVDKIREVDSVIPIYVVFTLFRGDQDGIGNQVSADGYIGGSGVWKVEEDRKVFNLMVKLNYLLTAYTNLHFIPIALTHDSEYNFGSIETPVNPRATQTEPQAIEATHPQNQGYLQMADIMFSTMSAHL